MNWTDLKILSFDVESCTGKPTDGSLCSFGYVYSERGEIVSAGDILVNPLPRAFTLGGYGKEPALRLAYPISQFRRAPRFDLRFCEIKGLFDKCDLAIGFALGNDLKYINDVCDKYSLPRIAFKFLDVQLLAGLIVEELADKGLKVFAERFGVEFIEHRSDEDARTAFCVLKAALEEAGLTLSGAIEKFGVVFGQNNAEGHTACYSVSALKNRAERMGHATRRLISDYYIKNIGSLVPMQGGGLRGKKIKVAEPLFSGLTAISVFSAGAAQGGEFVKEAVGSDIYVTDKTDRFAPRLKRMSRGTEIIMAENFLKQFPPAPVSVGYLEALIGHFSETIADR